MPATSSPSTSPSTSPAAPAPLRTGFAIDVPATLLARARAGDRAAFEQLYRWFERPVFTLALRMLGGRHGNGRDEAHEVLQDTMLKVIDRIGEFRGEGAGGQSPFWAWLRKIAINEALMRLRRGRRLEAEVCTGDEADFAEDHGPLPPAAADAALLQRALATLPATTRSVLWLYHAEFLQVAAGARHPPPARPARSTTAHGTRGGQCLMTAVRRPHRWPAGARPSPRCRWKRPMPAAGNASSARVRDRNGPAGRHGRRPSPRRWRSSHCCPCSCRGRSGLSVLSRLRHRPGT